jgi:hypothetical protein
VKALGVICFNLQIIRHCHDNQCEMEKMTRTVVTAALTLSAFACAPYGFGQGIPDTPSRRLLRASEAEQIAAMKSALDQGLPPEQFQVVGPLFFNRGSLVLPLVEQKIEQVLKSPSPLEYFTNKNVDPTKWAYSAALTIAETGDEQALKEIAKLIKLDEKRFGTLVGRALDYSQDYAKSHNPFAVAYRGFTIREPALDQRIAAWAESKLATVPAERARADAAARRYGARTAPAPSDKMKHLWAEAMLDQYGYVPTEAQWATDPIASRLGAPLAGALHKEVLQFALEAQEKRAGK